MTNGFSLGAGVFSFIAGTFLLTTITGNSENTILLVLLAFTNFGLGIFNFWLAFR